jgi:hypothetical protein
MDRRRRMIEIIATEENLKKIDDLSSRFPELEFVTFEEKMGEELKAYFDIRKPGK